MNWHIKNRYDQVQKQIEIEKLFGNLKSLEQTKQISFNNEESLKCELKSMGLKDVSRNNKRDLLSKEQYSEIREFVNDKNIIVRKAEKSNTFVVMYSQDYKEKVNNFVSDTEKFKEISKDPTEKLKTRLNQRITVANMSESKHFSNIKGNFTPGYLYGNPKIHKDQLNPPLRLIISQVGTITYEIAKTINDIITPYMPQKYIINSTYEFLQIAKTKKNAKMMASLDVESLFSNAPVSETVDIILTHVCNYKMKKPVIPQEVLRELLVICMTETSFRNHDGRLFVQIDGVPYLLHHAHTYTPLCQLLYGTH